jgi:nitrile hydratase accessory protein
MEATTLAAVLDVDGPAAPPRSNGELMFGEPWESRAFGLALTLHAGGRFDWEDFRRHLIAVIAEWERDHDGAEPWSYYACWLTALERVLVQGGLVEDGEVAARTMALAARPHGHDHRHDHNHDRDHDGHDHDGHDEGHDHGREHEHAC